ncbi:MAG TPA: NAD(P)/FAD-dependent oxidoreductase [Kofleriaceae bacterium]
MSWDVIVVGARCAGSPLARFLARAGKRVLLVDSATFPSDQPLSTHFIQPYGMEVLDELGLGDRVRAIAPPVTTMAQFVGAAQVRFHLPAGGCCPRRTELDQLLLDGAREAGAEARLGHRVIDLLREGSRVVGVVAQDRDGGKHELRAALVVGADGRNSTIGDLVGAEKYFNYESPRGAYWAYYPRPAWYADPPYDGATYVAFYEDQFRLSFPVNRDQLVVGVGFPSGEAEQWKADPRAAMEAALRTEPFFARLIDGNEPIGKLLGFVKLEYFFREAAGPGWALVGDAGLHKDPTAGFGITDALRDARALSAAILEGGDAALECYWRQRDVDSFELFNLARDMGELDYNNPLNQLVFTKIAGSQDLHDRMVRVINRELSPYAAIKPTEIIRWTLGALVRGKLGVFRPFMRAGKRQAEVAKELEQRRVLLAAALRSRSNSERVAA